ncbi:MAG: hypothetical protein HKO56_02910 [Bacteroidia bacterium]|nr:hypothetical protein [Bacteroidia bacterium]
MQIKSIWVRILLIFLILDTGYSFVQHYHQKLDGDVVGIVLPVVDCQPVLEDPFGLSVLLENESYAGTNRYFAHKIMYEYMRGAPLLLQYFVEPVTSLYLSAGIIKIILQVLLIYLLAVFITGKTHLKSKELIIAMVLIAPFFQATGYHEYFGIIDNSITYALFYAVGNVLVLLFFLPFILKYFHNRQLKFGVLYYMWLIALSVVISFHSPTNSGFILVMCPLVLMSFFYDGIKSNKAKSFIDNLLNGLKGIPTAILIIFVFIGLVSLYSFYIGTFNSQNKWTDVAITDRYISLVKGLWQIVTFKFGQFLFFALLAFNLLLVYKSEKGEERSKFFKLTALLLVFALIYTLLLPLGGFRDYRPLIIRRDTYMPVLFAFMILYGMSTLYIIKYLKGSIKKLQLVLVALLLVVLTAADSFKPEMHHCEKDLLYLIAESKKKEIILPGKCTVLSWGTKYTFSASENAAKLLLHWNIIEEPKRFKFQP